MLRLHIFRSHPLTTQADLAMGLKELRRGLEVLRGPQKLALCKKEARRAEDAARDARETFEKDLAKMLEKDDMLEEDTRFVADNMWRASQSNHTKKKACPKTSKTWLPRSKPTAGTKKRDSPSLIWRRW